MTALYKYYTEIIFEFSLYKCKYCDLIDLFLFKYKESYSESVWTMWSVKKFK